MNQMIAKTQNPNLQELIVELIPCFFDDPSVTPLNCGYTMRFLDVKNFRHYRPDGNPENEERLLENYITQFRKVLGDVIE